MGSFAIDHSEAWQATSLAASTITNGSETAIGTAIDLDGWLGAEVSIEVAYGGTATQGALVYVLGDIDGTNYEARLDNPFGFEMAKTTSTTHRKRFSVSAEDYNALKILVRNPSGASITVTVRYRRFKGKTA